MTELYLPSQVQSDLTSDWSKSPAEDVAEFLARLPATDRYEVGEEIARGGMGAVHRCRDRLLGRALAMKVVLPRHADRPELLKRFIEEAQVGGRLQHPGIVPVHEIGRLPDGRAFFAMKLVEGKTLAQLLDARRDATADRPRLLKVFEQICQTLGFAHAQRVVHRDLKPANVMVGEFGEVQVMDWGLAKVLPGGLGTSDANRPAPDTAIESGTDPGTPTEGATAAGAVLGTYAYMSPEQASGRAADTDERGDVFGLGAILCEILTGLPPYAGANGNDARTLALANDLTEAQSRLDRCGADPELVALCRRCLAVDAADRPANGRAVAEAMTGYLTGVAERLKQAEIERAAAAARARAERGKRRLTLALAATVLVGGAAAGGTWAWMREARRARLFQTAQEVNPALAGARESRRVADGLPARTIADWRAIESERNRALTDGEQAARALAAGEAEAAMRAELDELLPLLRSESDAASRNRAMLERLEAITYLANDALSDDDFDFYLAQSGNEDRFLYSSRRSRSEYAQAFREFGVDVAALVPAEAAAAIEREAIRPALLVALTDWLRLTDAGPDRDRLDAIVRAVEREPFRLRLLTAVKADDRPALLALARDDTANGLPLPALLLLADKLYEGGETAAAIALLRRAQIARPGEFWLSNKLGEYLMYTGSRDAVRVAEATRYFTAALVVRPTSQVARINLGDALTFLGEYDEAIDSYRHALADRPEIVFARTKYAIALAIAGDHELARTEIRRALELRPGSAWVHEAYGSVCSVIGLQAEAITAYRDAIERSPGVASYHSSLGQALSASGDHDAAIAAHRESIRLKPSGVNSARLADALVRRGRAGDLAAARIAATEARRLQPSSSITLLTQAGIESAAGRITQAIEILREAARIAPHDSGVWWQLGVSLGRDHRLDEASEILREAVRRGPPRGPRRVALLLDLADIQARRNATAVAETTYREAVKLSTNDSRAAERLMDLLLVQNRFDEAATIGETLLKTMDPRGLLRLKLIDIRDRQGRLDDAIALCTDPAVDDDPRFGRRHAKLLLDRDRAEDALDVIRPLTRRRTGNYDAAAWELRAAIMDRMNYLDEAVHAYELAMAAPPSVGYSYVGGAMEFSKLLHRRHRENGSAPTDPDLARGHSYRAWALANSNQPFAAAAEYRNLIKANPRDPRSHRNLADTLLKIHSPLEARTAIDAALKLAPDDPLNLDILGKCLLAVDDVSGAADAYRRAVAERNGDRYLPDYAECLVLAGRFADARTQFERAGDAAGKARCNALLARANQTKGIADGKTLPATDQSVEHAEFLFASGRVVAAARVYREAIRSGSLTDLDPLWRRAVAAAVQSGCGHADASTLTLTERLEWHRLARLWIRSAIDRVSSELPDPNKVSKNLALISGLRFSLALRGVRTSGESSAIPEPAEWERIWSEVDMLQRLINHKLAQVESSSTR
jgi:tetratricopeptide (TPR) repeat protein